MSAILPDGVDAVIFVTTDTQGHASVDFVYNYILQNTWSCAPNCFTALADDGSTILYSSGTWGYNSETAAITMMVGTQMLLFTLCGVMGLPLAGNPFDGLYSVSNINGTVSGAGGSSGSWNLFVTKANAPSASD
jgi:hypothetical protein